MNTVIVAVHPYFGGFPGEERAGGPGASAEDIERFLARQDAPIITLTNDVEKVIARYDAIGIGNQGYFLRTTRCDPTPLDGDWPSLDGILSGLEPRIIQLVGGLYWPNRHPEDRGCLGYTQHIIERMGYDTRIEEEAVFGQFKRPLTRTIADAWMRILRK